MKFLKIVLILLASLIVLLCLIGLIYRQLTLTDEWETFKLNYNKTYRSEAEEHFRKKVFYENKARIDEHNLAFENGTVKFTRTINKYSDYNQSEVTDMFLPSRDAPPRNPLREVYRFTLYTADNNKNIPDSFDWRTRGGVTPVRDQNPLNGDGSDHKCGSCYAFATAASVESHYLIKAGNTTVLSVQQIVSCSQAYGNNGCNGGNFFSSYEYILDNGLASEENYPYENYEMPFNVEKPCRFNKENTVQNISGYVLLESEANMRAVIAQIGPIGASLKADEIVDYQAGIFHAENGKPNHAVLIVGYDTDTDGTKYWIVKNSFGPDWGENGYFRIVRDVNMCGIEDYGTYPLID